MKRVKTALMFFCLVLVAKGETLSVCKSSQNVDEDVEQAKSLIKDLNTAMEKVFVTLDTCLVRQNCVGKSMISIKGSLQ